MRLLFFLESLHGGGKERRSVELIRFLKQQPEKYEIMLVLTEEEIYYEEVFSAAVRIRILKRKGLKYDPTVFLKFYAICREFHPDIIHAWGKMTTFYAIPAKMMLGIPLVSSLIADASRRYSGMSPYNFLLKTNLRFSDSVLANSRAGLRAYGITDRKARVIYNGADLRRFDIDCDSRSIKKELGISTEFVVIMVASFSTFKDYDLFIDTAKAIGEIRRDVTFLAVGDGPEWKRISKRVTDEKITNVILTGRRKDVESLVSVSDIGLLCTWTEGISNSILEYMALGKPVISTDLRGGSRELIDDGMTGYCTRRDVNSVAGLVNKLLNNSDLRIRMGKRGKDRIWSRFSINRMGKEFQELYTDVLTRKKTPELEKNTAR